MTSRTDLDFLSLSLSFVSNSLTTTDSSAICVSITSSVSAPAAALRQAKRTSPGTKVSLKEII